MVIERALEKMRQAGQAKTPATPPSQTGTTGVYPRPSSPPPKTVFEKPVFPLQEIDIGSAKMHRILVPEANNAKDAAAAAAYRMLRTRLLQRLRGNHWAILAVTSPGAGEGKSLTVLNLALNLARDKANDVFVLDLDMRNPSICKYLGVTPQRELVSYFSGEGSAAETLFSIGVPNLALAGSTVSSTQASELLTSGRLEELVAHIKSVAPNPLVLIDLPPVLVTDEALMVAPRVDATILVVAEGRTRRDSLARAKHLLADFNVAGVILNRSLEQFGADSYYGDAPRYEEPTTLSNPF